MEVGIGLGAVVDVGVGEDKEVEVGDGIEVGVGVGVFVVVGVGTGVEVETGDGVLVGLDVSLGKRVGFVTTFVASVAPTEIAWIFVTTAIAPTDEISNNVKETTPTSSLLGVSLAKKALSERWSLPEPASTIFFIFASLDCSVALLELLCIFKIALKCLLKVL